MLRRFGMFFICIGIVKLVIYLISHVANRGAD